MDMRGQFDVTTTALLDERDDTAVVLADISVERFLGAAERHPRRVVNVGIREQALVGIAAGFALEGFVPIVHSYTPFLLERPFEQVKLDFGHQDVPGLFVSVGASYDASREGRTHQSPGDVALLDTLDGWTVHIPGHPEEVPGFMRDAVTRRQRAYVRLSSATNAAPHARPDGGMTVVRRGTAGTVVAVGPMLDRVLLATDGLDGTVLYAATVRPFDDETLVGTLTRPDVVLVEPYLAGTSSAVVSAALSYVPHRLLALGVPRAELRRYGSRAQHDAAHGLDAAGLRASIVTFFR